MRTLALMAALAVFAAAPLAAQVTLDVGFEAPDYTVGPINGQQGWNVQLGDEASQVTDQWSVSGSQGLAVGGATSRWTVHPVTGGELFEMEVVMAKEIQNNNQWWVAAQSPITGTQRRSAMFGFNNGNIQYYSNAAWVTVMPFQTLQNYHFRAVTDISTKTWSLWIDGELKAENVATGLSTAAIPTEIYFYHTGNSGLGLADDLKFTIVPEPASMLTLLAGCGALATRLRKRR